MFSKSHDEILCKVFFNVVFSFCKFDETLFREEEELKFKLKFAQERIDGIFVKLFAPIKELY